MAGLVQGRLVDSLHADGAVIWITGLSGAGKSTLCNAVAAVVKPVLPQLVVLDGDAIRAAFEGDLDYTEPGRHRQITRVRNLAGVLARQGQVVLVGALYSHPDLLSENRRVLPNYFEVYLRASMRTLRDRDAKGLYAAADSGAMTDVVGVDIVWREPTQPDLVLDTDSGCSSEELARRLIGQVPRLRRAIDSWPT
jgi:adenylylsulfate kinase-like enzyme